MKVLQVAYDTAVAVWEIRNNAQLDRYRPCYVADYDPETGLDTSAVELTNDIRWAMKFADAGAALEFWRLQCRPVPLRDDGKPNRPVTAFTVSIEDDRPT